MTTYANLAARRPANVAVISLGSGVKLMPTK
jgi:hypothetical protein